VKSGNLLKPQDINQKQNKKDIEISHWHADC
jgi:hypothetical protein